MAEFFYAFSLVVNLLLINRLQRYLVIQTLLLLNKLFLQSVF